MWKRFFADNPEYEELYEAFRDRYDAEQEDPDLIHEFDAEAEREKLAQQAEQERREEHHCNYLRTEFYREQHAKQKGYTFKPKPYDPEGKYR